MENELMALMANSQMLDEMHITIPMGAVHAYRHAASVAGLPMTEEEEADFIAWRNLNGHGMRELNEFRKLLESYVKDIKAVIEHTYNIGDIDNIEQNDGVKISWSKQSFTTKWAAEGAGVEVIRALSKKGLLTVDQALCEVSPDAVIRASGISKDKLINMFPDAIVEEPKKRTLNIK